MRLAEEQVHMIRHNHVANQAEIELRADFSKHLKEQISRADCLQIRMSVIATESNEMKVALPITALQSFWHGNRKEQPQEGPTLCKHRKG
jgi:tyrosyl-tRNA synthetase